MIKPPPAPKDLPQNVFKVLGEEHRDKISEYLDLYKPVDDQGRYLHFDQLRFRLPQDIDHNLAWAVIKSARSRQYSDLLPIGESTRWCKFILTPTAQKAISITDRNATTAALEYMSSKIGEETHFKYLLNDLIEDEAISSSQLEGAATTTRIAKDMLKKNRKPRTPDEKMILGNFRMMKFAWENRRRHLSLDFIKEIHSIGVEGIEDKKYSPGKFRVTDDVIVEDSDGNAVHYPPPAEGIEQRLRTLTEWINTCHDDASTSSYIHPLIKAISLHFAIGYEHPFRDGNGRVARSLFYWFMFKSDYAAFRYIAISVLLKGAPAKYGHSYIYTETDELDLTYFIDYQCSVITRSISGFKEAFQKSFIEVEEFNKWIWESGLYKKLSEKQKTVFQVAKSGKAKVFSTTNVKENLGCSYNTASSVLNGLAGMNIFEKERVGREWLYRMKDKAEIQKSWTIQS